MTQILLARHGEPDWENAGENRDPGLTELGREQAKRLGVWLTENSKVDALYASPLMRARETAEIVNNSLRLPIQFRDGLREWHERSTVVAELPHPHLSNRFAHPFQSVSHDGLPENYLSFSSKIHSALNQIVSSHSSKTVLVVCHGGVIGQVFRNLLGNHNVPFHSDFTGVSRIFFEERHWVVGYLNRLDHLHEC